MCKFYIGLVIHRLHLNYISIDFLKNFAFINLYYIHSIVFAINGKAIEPLFTYGIFQSMDSPEATYNYDWHLKVIQNEGGFFSYERNGKAFAFDKFPSDRNPTIFKCEQLTDKSLKSKATKVVVKEIRFGPQTDDHDYEFKKKHAEKFLKDGAKLKAFVFFKGRSIVFKEQGQILLLRLAQDLEEYGKVEQMPKLEGKRMIMFISPKKK